MADYKDRLMLTTYRCGYATGLEDVLKIGVVRFLPRGVRKEDYARRGYFDVWLPLLAPSPELIREFKKEPATGWHKFSRSYRRAMTTDAAARAVIALLRETARRMPVAIGCYCEDETRCHRSILKGLIEEGTAR